MSLLSLIVVLGAGDVARNTSAPLALTADEASVAVSDELAGDVVLTDATTLEVQARIAVGERADQMVRLESGELAVACAGSDWIAIVDPVSHEVTRVIPTDLEPRGIATDGATLYVAAFGSATLGAFDAATGVPLWTRRVAQNPHRVMVANGQVYVGHIGVGPVERFDADGSEHPSDPVVDGVAAFVPTFGHAYAATIEKPEGLYSKTSVGGGSAYGGADDWTMYGTLVDLVAMFRESSPFDQSRSGRRYLHHWGSDRFFRGRRMPMTPASIVGGVEHPHGIFLVDLALGRLWVVDTTQRLPELDSSHELGVAPTGIVIDRSSRRMFIAYSHTRSLGVAEVAAVLADERHAIRTVELGPIDSPEARGRLLFNVVDARISTRGLACATCHPGGLSDGRVWTQSFGPRQTPVLAGRSDTAPFGWLGQQPTLEAQIRETIRHRILGNGLPKKDIEALAAYLESMPAPRTATADVARGRALFSDPVVGCASCHDPSTRFTDGARYDVGTTNDDERWRSRDNRLMRLVEHARPEPTPIAFDVPSLIGLAHSAPYFHDGSAKTLRDVLRPDGRHLDMGSTSHLSEADLRALIAYLETL